ncbi:MAG: HAD-IIB family hydrolase [Desulfobacterium sp.]|jgi:HAD superfamily hydrolase (TIGR01484 family)|nr:HAD-IIB family hydrolase [Desulfobacterium sp.]
MDSIDQFQSLEEIQYLLTDIDDTMTTKGKIPACAFAAMERLQQAGIRVVPITGRPGGWCDHIARMWPVEGIVGENGAFYFAYDPTDKKMVRRYFKPEAERVEDKRRILAIQEEILARVPGCRVSEDQPYRVADLAIDFCEDVEPLGNDEIKTIVEIFESHGAVAKISSIHVNGWFGNYDKLTMTELFFKEVFGVDLEAVKHQVIFSGDSPNDEPMFAFFPNAVGVANIVKFEDDLVHRPAWVTSKEGGQGFAEMVDKLLAKKC